MSLASVANSVEGSPNRGLNLTPKKNRGLPDADVIDFGSLGNEDSEEEEDADADAEGEEEDEEEEEERGVENGDVEVLNLGSPARPQLHEHEMQDEVQETVEGEEEEDPLAAALLAGFGEAGAESEESEEE